MGEKRQGRACCWIEKWIFNCEWERGFVGVSCYAWRLVYISCYHCRPVACWISLLKLMFLGGIFLYSTFKFTVFRLVSWEGVRWSVLLHLTTAHPYELRAADAWSARCSFQTLQLVSEAGFAAHCNHLQRDEMVNTSSVKVEHQP